MSQKGDGYQALQLEDSYYPISNTSDTLQDRYTTSQQPPNSEELFSVNPAETPVKK